MGFPSYLHSTHIFLKVQIWSIKSFNPLMLKIPEMVVWIIDTFVNN